MQNVARVNQDGSKETGVGSMAQLLEAWVGVGYHLPYSLFVSLCMPTAFLGFDLTRYWFWCAMD